MPRPELLETLVATTSSRWRTAVAAAGAAVAAAVGPGTLWPPERALVMALIPLGVSLDRSMSTPQREGRVPVGLLAAMTAGAVAGFHGALVVAPFVTLGAAGDAAGFLRQKREAFARIAASLAFGGAFKAFARLPDLEAWAAALAPGIAGGALASLCFVLIAGTSGEHSRTSLARGWRAAALPWFAWSLTAAGVARIHAALGPAGVAFFLAPIGVAWLASAEGSRELAGARRALSAMRRRVLAAESRARRDLRALERVAAAVDQRCYGDLGRSRRVADLAVRLLRELRRSDVTLLEEDLYRAALLRDVGLLAVREEVLRNAGTLTPAERSAIVAHPEHGFWLLAGDDLSDTLLQIVRAHHERYDGQGYPRRLRSLSIPLGARVLAVADALVAMLSTRVYRDALPLEMALQELRHGRGTQFDPDVVDACLVLIERTGGVPWEVERAVGEAGRAA